MRVTLVITSLGPGGAEKILALVANWWAERGHTVSLLTMASSAEDRHALHAAVHRVALDMVGNSRNAAHGLCNNLRRIARLRGEIARTRPNAVVSFLSATNVLTLAATRRLDVPVIVAERIDPRREPISTFWARTRRLLYPRADGIVVQTPEVRDWALRFVPPERVHVIPNPAVSSNGDSRGSPPATPEWLRDAGPRIFAVGRLTWQKGFDLLLRAFAACHTEHPEWSLVVLGEGEERGALLEQARRLGIASAVALPGYVDRAAVLLRRGDLFVLSSRYEGFPNALLDAMMCGLPVIATDCPSGPRQIVRNGVDGVLVEPDNVDALSAAMKRLMESPDLRRRLASRSVEVSERFSMPRVLHQWDTLLARCSRES